MGLFQHRREAYLQQEVYNLQKLLLEQTQKNAKLQEQVTQLQSLIEKVQEPWREKLQQMTEKYNELSRKYQQVESTSESFQELQAAHDMLKEENHRLNQSIANQSVTAVSKLMLVEQERTPVWLLMNGCQKTSIEIWMEKLSADISRWQWRLKDAKTEEKKRQIIGAIEKAERKLTSVQKGFEGESLLRQQLLKMMKSKRVGNSVMILQDLCFHSALSDKQRDLVQIDFLVITDFAIFILDSKYRSGIEVISEDDKKAESLQAYRNEIMVILSQNGIAQKYHFDESRIYSMLVYSGQNEVNHSGFHVKSTDAHSGYYETSHIIEYIFMDNLVEEVEGIYSLEARNLKEAGRLSKDAVLEMGNQILVYISENGYDSHMRCPYCSLLMEKSKFGEYEMYCKSKHYGVYYKEDIMQEA